MNQRKSLPVGALFMIMAMLLATLGVAYGLWSKTLTIRGTVNTGAVHAQFVGAFTDDDDKVDDPLKDSQDTDECVDVGFVGLATDNDGFTSCDPAASGRDPKPHYEKDVAACIAAIEEDPNFARVTKFNTYPSYFCTAWFDILYNGTVPARIASVTINGIGVVPSVPKAFDLSGDGKPDVQIHISEIRQCQQVDPRDLLQMDIDQHVLQDAPQGTQLSYVVEVQLNQFNESGCRVLLYHGNSGVAPGAATGYPGADGDLNDLKLHYEALGFTVDYTSVWPADLSVYHLVLLYGSGNENDADFYSAAQVADLKAYLASGKRVVVSTDWNDFGGTAVPNKLLTDLGVGIQKRTPTTFATPNGDACIPLTDVAPEVALFTKTLDPAATTPLDLSGTAIPLAKVDAAPYDCLGIAKNGETWMARDGQVVVNGDPNSLDDNYGFGDPAGDGMTGAQLANYLVDF